jgi:UDP-N-acetylmuramate dehydrogenase
MSALPTLRPAELRGELRVREPMSRHVSWRAGGAADRYYRPADADDLAEFLHRLPAGEAILWLGLGSNLLVRDGGFRGTVIAMHGVLDRIDPLPATGADEAGLRVGSGVHCARLAKYCAQQGLGGAAFFAGIPGTVGGALAMNAGAWGGETWGRVVQVEVMDRSGNRSVRPASDFRIGYRTVKAPQPDACFLGADMRFPRATDSRARDEIRELLAARKASQPVGQPSCGSVFRNPPGGHAAQLIESAGLKGYRIGDAVVSTKHANFILNAGEARANDIEDLVHHLQRTVEQVHGISMETEVRIVGERDRTT